MDGKGTVVSTRACGRGPTIWLAGPPPDLEKLMPLGIAGIVTNTVVLNQYAKPYGSVIAADGGLPRDDRQAGGHRDRRPHGRGTAGSRQNLHRHVAASYLKIPCTLTGLKAFSILRQEGIETFCTTVFSLAQAAAVAQAGVNHILPFCDPVREMGGDPTRLIRECAAMFKGWGRPTIHHGRARAPR